MGNIGEELQFGMVHFFEFLSLQFPHFDGTSHQHTFLYCNIKVYKYAYGQQNVQTISPPGQPGWRQNSDMDTAFLIRPVPIGISSFYFEYIVAGR